MCALKYFDVIFYAAYDGRTTLRQKLDKMDGSGRSYLYATLQEATRILNLVMMQLKIKKNAISKSRLQ